MNERLQRVRLIVSDVDGVLTDGKIRLVGADEMKVFCGKDAPRFRAAADTGLPILLFTARRCDAIERRARELRADLLYKDAIADPESLLEYLHSTYGVDPDDVLYVGDDWSDIPFQRRCGLRVVPADGSEENKSIADYVTMARGGEGVAAEVIELVMRAQGSWDRYRSVRLGIDG